MLEALEPGRATFTLHRGEILGVAGLIGSGGTVAAQRFSAWNPCNAGRLRVALVSGSASPRRRWQQGVGMLSEDRKDEGLALGLDVGDNLTITRLEPFGRAGLVSPARQASAADRWIAQLDIKCAGPDQAAAELSGGNQQKIAMAVSSITTSTS